MTRRKIGIVKVSFVALESALHLPEGHRIRGLRITDNFTDTFEIAVEGPSFQVTDESEAIPRVQYTVTVTEDREQLVPARTFVGKFS
jgi:hypothetical protein